MPKMIFFFYMFLILLLFISNILSITYPHPTLTIFLILLNTLSICFLMSFWQTNLIFSILLFLIMISGLLIIFLYFSSLITNMQNKFTINLLMFINFIINLIIFMFSSFIYFFYNMFPNNNYLEMLTIMHTNQEMFQKLFMIYSHPFSNFTFLCMFFLLISMFTIIKMCTIKTASLRKIS